MQSIVIEKYSCLPNRTKKMAFNFLSKHELIHILGYFIYSKACFSKEKKEISNFACINSNKVIVFNLMFIVTDQSFSCPR